MELLPLHPKLVHLPIALALLMPFIAGGLSAAIRRELLPARAWVIVVLLQAVLLLSALAAANSGENDAERAKLVVPHAAIEAHEDAANAFIAACAGVLALTVVAHAAQRPSLKRALITAALAGTVFVMFLAQRAGEAGGALVYVHGAASAFVEDAKGPKKTP